MRVLHLRKKPVELGSDGVSEAAFRMSVLVLAGQLPKVTSGIRLGKKHFFGTRLFLPPA